MPIAKKKILIKDFHGDVIARYESINACAKDLNLSSATVKHEADKVRIRKDRTSVITYEDESDRPTEVKLANVWVCDEHNVHIVKGKECPMCKHKQEDEEVKQRIIKQFQQEDDGYEY